MKKLICSTPGKMEYAEAPMPVMKHGQAILKIKRVGICGTDLHAYDGTQPYFSYPRVLGHEVCGEIVDCDTEGFSAGDIVSLIPYYHCGDCIACRKGKYNCCVQMKVCGVHMDGAMADYLSVPASHLVPGNGLGLDELAMIEPLSIAAHGIRRAAVLPGEFVLVMGAGPIGLAAMQFAHRAGAQVIAVDLNTRRLQFCRNHLGVLYAIDGNEDIAAQLAAITGGDMPTVVIDATGNLDAINSAFTYMSHGGRYVLIGLQKEAIAFNHPEFHKREGSLFSSRNALRQDFMTVIEAVKKGEIQPTTYITHRVNFDDAGEAFAGWTDLGNGVIKAMIEMD
jgi:2-desacetyl-2-hydroxyethyl bacteriochlorophyllide A dehydrogenase